MRILHLLVEDDYIETFMETLPKDKITVIEEDFKDNKKKLQNEFDRYKDGDVKFKHYTDSMKELNSWLKKQEL